MFQHPVPTEDKLSSFYPESYYAYEPPNTDFIPRGLRHRLVWLKLHYLKYLRRYQHLPVWKNPILAFIGSLLDPRPFCFAAPEFSRGGCLLDYGSGTGSAVAFMQYIGWNAEGIEFNAMAAQAGKEAGLAVHHGSIETLENLRDRYDYVMTSHCVEHVPDVWRLFRAFYTALKPGGTLAVDVPNADAVAVDRYGKFYYFLGMPVHVHVFAHASITYLAKAVGFRAVSVGTYSRWESQARSEMMKLRSKHKPSPQEGFFSLSKREVLWGRIRAIPTYLSSQKQGRGDCLVMVCKK